MDARRGRFGGRTRADAGLSYFLAVLCLYCTIMYFSNGLVFKEEFKARVELIYGLYYRSIYDNVIVSFIWEVVIQCYMPRLS